MTYVKVYEKPGDWQGTTRMFQKVNLSFHNGFRDDVNELEIDSDICYIHLRLYECDDWTGERKRDYQIASTLITPDSLNVLIDALVRARDHMLKQHDIWRDQGQKWLSSNGGRHPGPQDEQNRIYNLPWEDVTDKYVEEKK